jgi:hypothetical protein
MQTARRGWPIAQKPVVHVRPNFVVTSWSPTLAERRDVGEAQKIVAIWNARQAGGRALWFYPTIGAAIAAGFPWLSFSCAACGQWGSVDLRTLDRHLGGAISGLIPSLSCRRCLPDAPFARLEMLTSERP